MTLASIKVGDVVHVDKKGRRFYAVVTGRVGVGAALVGSQISGTKLKGGELTIMPCCRETYRTATAREIVGHYKKMAGSA